MSHVFHAVSRLALVNLSGLGKKVDFADVVSRVSFEGYIDTVKA